jgi:N-acetylmuramoyl-L-alanine amidase
MMKIIERPSPNHGPRRGPVDMLILHYTGMRTTAEALDRLCSPEAAVSAHYLIDEDGTVLRLVPEDRRAWHAGKSSWAGREDINSASIGIELANPGHEWGYNPFPDPQMSALEALAEDILQRYRIPARFVLGHSDVAPDRKLDPGELFDWTRLARRGIGLWPDAEIASAGVPQEIAAAQGLLAAIGYACPQSGALDGPTRQVITAFQRHFRPQPCNGALDRETFRRIAAVAALCGAV